MRSSGPLPLPEEDRADVFAPPARVRAVHQPIARLGQVAIVAADDLEDGVVVERLRRTATRRFSGKCRESWLYSVKRAAHDRAVCPWVRRAYLQTPLQASQAALQ